MKFKLIKCPRQPGNLRISKKACALRYREAQKIGGEIPVREFDVVRKIGLETCKTCPVGRDNAVELQISNRKDEAALTSACINRALKENTGGKTDHERQ
jgi:hypothetical protein